MSQRIIRAWLSVLSAVFINAFKEQQTQIERQQTEIDELKELLCSMQPQAGVCKQAKGEKSK